MTFTNTRKETHHAFRPESRCSLDDHGICRQQTQIAVRPGSGVVRTRERGYRHTPRVLDEAARAKHAAKMQRRYNRWADGLIENPCVSREQFSRLFFSHKG